MLQYKSQSDYGRHGLRICTPVCLLVCANFMRFLTRVRSVDDVYTFFDSHVIDSYMRASHALYDELFPDTTVPVMLKALLPLLTRDNGAYQEVAGMNHGPCETVEVDDLRVGGLGSLIESRLEPACGSSALLITVGGHTTCLLFDAPTGRVFHFDPLPAALRDVTAVRSLLMCVGGDLTKPAMSYDGLLLLGSPCVSEAYI